MTGLRAFERRPDEPLAHAMGAGLDAAGVSLDDNGRVEVRVTDDPGVSKQPSLIWTGSHFGIAWQDAPGGTPEVYFVALSPTGELRGAPVAVSSDPAPSLNPFLHWNGATYVASWHDDRHEGEAEVYLGFIGGCW